jgi:hypothetical protein
MATIAFMGWTLTGVTFVHQGKPIAVFKVSASGNNAAWVCPCETKGAVLFVYQSGRQGSRRDRPTKCRSCGSEYFLDPPYDTMPEPADVRVPTAQMVIQKV